MTIGARVPFGLREADQQLVGVSEVPNGQACGCICPSCHTPLVARQGGKRGWHFAHRAKQVYDDTEELCDYSFYVSVVLMAKQLFQRAESLALPRYVISVDHLDDDSHQIYRGEVVVTLASTARLDRVAVETTINDAPVDILAYVKDVPLAIYLTHPERPLPVAPSIFEGSRIGVLEIKIDAVHVAFAAVESVGDYRKALAWFLFEEESGKDWLYHPRQGAKRAEAKRAWMSGAPAKEQPSTVNVPVFPSSTPTYQLRRALCECVMCDIQWSGWAPGRNLCPECKEWLLVRVVSSQ